MHTRIAPLVLAATVLALPGVAVAAEHPHATPVTRYVSPAGNDSHDCSAADAPHACKTIGHAVTIAATGDTISIAAGTYAESVTVPTTKSLTLIGAGSGTATSASGATEIDGQGTAPALLLEGGGSVSGVRLIGSHGAASVGEGLDLSGPLGLTATYTVTNVVAFGGVTSGGNGTTAVHAEVGGLNSKLNADLQNVTGISTGTEGNGLEIHDGAGAHNVITVENSTFTPGDGGDGVYATGADLTLTGVTVNATGASTGIQSEATLSVNQSIVRGGGYGINAVNYGNTVVRDSLVVAQPTGAQGAALLMTAGNTATTTITGSTLLTSSAASAAESALEVMTGSGTTQNVTITNSVVRALTSAGAPIDGYYDIVTVRSGGAGAATVTASHSYYGVASPDAGTTITAPTANGNIQATAASLPFASWTGGDYSPSPTSALVDAGDPTAVIASDKDVTGAARSVDGNGDCQALPDIGAYELQGHAGSTPQPTITGPTTVGVKKVATFTAAPATGATYTWAFSDGGTAAGVTVTHAWKAGGHASATVTAVHALCAPKTATAAVTVDATPPKVTAFKLTPKSFKPLASGPSIVTRGGAKVTFTISEVGTVQLHVVKLVKGHTVKGRCVAGAPTASTTLVSKACTFHQKISGVFAVVVKKKGAVTFRFSGRIGGKKLGAGSFQLTATAADAYGNIAAPVAAAFTVPKSSTVLVGSKT